MKKRVFILSTLLLLMAAPSFAQRRAQNANRLVTPSDSVSYALGFLAGNNIAENYPELEDELKQTIFQQALEDGLNGRGVWMDTYKIERYLRDYFAAKRKIMWQGNIETGRRFLEENKLDPEVHVTSSGLQYKIVRPGDDDNERPRPYDDMVITYTAKTIDGQVFDSEEKDYTYPATLNDGLEEGTQLMSPGAKYIFYMPYELAYGEEGKGRLTPYSTAIYEVEMISMTRDHNYYDEDEEDYVSFGHSSDDSEPQVREAGDYTMTMLPNLNLNVSVNGYEPGEIVKTYQSEGFTIVMTEDKTIVLDSENREIFRNKLDEESNSYDSYYLAELRANDGRGPVFLVLDMGFTWGNYFGSMLYIIEDGQFREANKFLNLVAGGGEIDDEYGRLSPVLNLRRNGERVEFHFDSSKLAFNPAGTETPLAGDDFYYTYENGNITEDGPATALRSFRINALTDQFRDQYDYRIWYADTGDVDSDGKDDLVVFVYENETIYVCQLDGGQLGEIQAFDLPYDYTINRSTGRVVRGNTITVKHDDDGRNRVLTVRNGNLVEVE